MKRKRVFQKELKSLMFGFGDSSNPLPESVDLMDELVDWFVADLCTTAAKKSISSKLKTADFLAALEGQPKKLARAHELLNLDKILKEARSTFGEAVVDIELDLLKVGEAAGFVKMLSPGSPQENKERMESEISKLLFISDQDFIKIWLDFHLIFHEKLQDTQKNKKSLQESSLNVNQIHSQGPLNHSQGPSIYSQENPKNQFLIFKLFYRAFSIIPPSEWKYCLSTPLLLLFLEAFFIDETKELIHELLADSYPNYQVDLDDILSSIVNQIKQLEKGGGKKKVSSVDLGLVVEMFTILKATSYIWPLETCRIFWNNHTSVSSISFLYDAATKSIVDDGTDLDDAKRSKTLILETLHHILAFKFWKPLCRVDTDKEEIEMVVNEMCDWTMSLMDSTNIDEKVKCCHNAPLLLDYEVCFQLSDQVKKCIELHADVGLDRFEYLLLSLEHIVTYSGSTQAQIESRKKSLKSKESTDNNPPAYSVAVAADSMPSQELILAISHVQDLFPELGEGFIEECLKEFDNDPEVVIIHVLENQFPPHLQNLDRSTPSRKRSLAPLSSHGANQLVHVPSFESVETALDREEEQITQPDIADDKPDVISDDKADAVLVESRRNVFDGDQFDVFQGRQLDPTLVHRGKKEKNLDFEVDRKEFLELQKQKILSSSQYEDEYDDTYEAQDVKLSGLYETDDGSGHPPGGIASKSQKDSRDSSFPQERILVDLFNSDPSAFHPSYRNSRQRKALCSQLNMTNEQIEGWFIMLNRNPQKEKILEKYEWRGNKPFEEEVTEDSTGSPRSLDTKKQMNESTGSPRASNNRGGSHRGRGRGGRSKRGQRIYRPPNE